jgi:hypothetical protein
MVKARQAKTFISLDSKRAKENEFKCEILNALAERDAVGWVY